MQKCTIINFCIGIRIIAQHLVLLQYYGCICSTSCLIIYIRALEELTLL